MASSFDRAYDRAMEFIKMAEQPGQANTAGQPRRLSRTYSNAVVQRQVDPALQIGGPGKQGYTAEISDPQVEQAYRQILKQSGMTSPRSHEVYNILLERARARVYGPQMP